VDAIKHELTVCLPHVKSSHRCEAIARGFGFLTYASLKVASTTANPPNQIADGMRFSAYLAEHGFAVPSTVFYHAAARRALQGAMAAMPRLTLAGIGIGARQWKLSEGRWETASERKAKFDSERAALVGDFPVRQFLISLALLSRVQRTKTVRPKTNSYWLKHVAEKYKCTYPDGQPLGPSYVANGAFIAAAAHAGFTIQTHVDDGGYCSLNTTFNMPFSTLAELDIEIRGDGASVFSRRRRASERYGAVGFLP